MSDLHVVALVDLMGTKALIEDDSQWVSDRFRVADRIFIDTISEYLPRSRSLTTLAFSDSYIIMWDDPIEARRFVLEVLHHLHEKLFTENISSRAFAALSPKPDFSEDRFDRFAMDTPKIMRFSPVSLAVWSVFFAESRHFAPGIYIDEALTSLLSPRRNYIYCSIPPFKYRRSKR